MKKVLLSITISFALIASAFAQSTVPSYFTQTVVGGRAIASSFGQYKVHSLNATASGAASMTLDSCYVAQGANNVPQFPFATNVKITIVDGANTESVTPSAVTTPTPNTSGGPNPYNCSLTATFSNAHNTGASIISADDGAMEAANFLQSTGGLVVLDPSVPSGVSVTAFTGTFANVTFEDLRSGDPVFFVTPANGTAYAASNSVGLGLPAVYSCGTVAAAGACANTAPTKASHAITGIATLASNTSTITGIAPAFTSSSTYFCVANDITTRANPVQAVPASGSTVTFTNTTGATDNISFVCIGY